MINQFMNLTECSTIYKYIFIEMNFLSQKECSNIL